MALTARSILILFLTLASVGACGNPDQKESKKLANEAAKAANMGKLSEAEDLLEKSTATYRDNANAWYMLGYVREQLAKKPEEYTKAAEAYSEAARVKDDSAMYHYKLGKMYWLSNNMSSAQSSLERAVQLEKRLYNAQYQLGSVYEKQGKPKQAAEAYTAAATVNPTFGLPFVDLGALYIKWDMLEQAISVLDQGRLNVRDGDDLTNIYYNLGLAYKKQGNWDKAIEAYGNAIQTRPSNLDALRQRGFAYAEKGDSENAKKDLKSYVDQGGDGNAFYIQAANQRLFSLAAAQ